jgi:hypothetical protein
MISQLSQETVAEYASDALTIQEPQGADYSRGAQVGRTIPAKWWNWLFNAVTKRASQSKADAQSMLDELKSVVTDAGLTPDASDNTQLAQAVVETTDRRIVSYVNRKRWFFERISKISQRLLDEFSGGTTYGRPACVSYSGSVGCAYLRYITYENYITLNGCKGCVDGVHWFDVPIGSSLPSTTGVNLRPQIVLLKIKNTYVFIYLFDGKYTMLCSEDLINWTKVTGLNVGDTNRVDDLTTFQDRETLYIQSSYRGVFATHNGFEWSRVYNIDTMASYYNKITVIEELRVFNGKYLLGNALFDATTNQLTPVLEGAVIDAAQPSRLLSNGTLVFYPPFPRTYSTYYTCRVGETPVQHTQAEYTDSWGITADKKVLYKVKRSSGTPDENFSLLISFDGVNTIVAGTFTRTSTSENVPTRLIYSNGWYYFCSKRTQDFQAWENVPNLSIYQAERRATIIDTGFTNILVARNVSSGASDKEYYVSFDDCAHWALVHIDPIVDSNSHEWIDLDLTDLTSRIFNIRGMSYLLFVPTLGVWHGTQQMSERYAVIYSISETVNHVEGYTLYLR